MWLAVEKKRTFAPLRHHVLFACFLILGVDDSGYLFREIFTNFPPTVAVYGTGIAARLLVIHDGNSCNCRSRSEDLGKTFTQTID